MAFRATGTAVERASKGRAVAPSAMLAACFALSGALSACHATLPSCDAAPPAAAGEYVLVEYRLREGTGIEPKTEASDTDTYRTGQSYPTAALRLPDACANDAATGPNHCATWAKEIESALASEGVRVIGSDPVVKLEREKSLSTYGAAKELGADIVFVFNTLDAREITVNDAQIASHKTYASDAQGKRGAPLTLDADTSASFLAYTSSETKKALEPGTVLAHSSKLDATAIVTKTGESIWFYRRSLTVPTSASQGMRFLFGRAPGGQWAPALPVGVKDEPPAPAASATPPPAAPTGEGAAGAGEAHPEIQRKLMAESAKDFVAAFKSGKVDTQRDAGLAR